MSSLTAPAQPAGAASPAVLPRGLCRDAFDQAILKIERERGTQQFDNAFHRLVADAVFDACWEALEHFAEHNEQRGFPEPASQSELRAVIGGKIGNTVPPRLHVVSAPMGTGKTTFTIAFIMALVELGKRIPQMPQGCVYLTDQIVKADYMYRQLNHFLSGRVAIWTSDHDPDCTEPKKVFAPAARFRKDDLKHYPVAIAIHALFKMESADMCPWRVHKDVPRVRYDRLSVIHVEPCTKERLNEYLRVDENRAAYVEWMKQVIQERMQPHERGLVVCKKILIERGNVPDFSNIKTSVDEPTSANANGDPTAYPWNVEGRHVAITYWGGPGIGSNDWKDADVVFLFDEYFIPKGAAIGRTQGLVLAPTSSGPIASMSTSNTTSEEVSWIDEGHLLRWTKQMAMRGRARHFDHQGICGEQKLVLTGDYERLLLNWSLLFPGAKLSAIRQSRDLSAYASRRRQLIEIFSDPELPIRVPTADIGDRLGVKWKDVTSSLIDDDMKTMLRTLGWAYVSRKGAGGAYFERVGALHGLETESGKSLDKGLY